MLFKEPQKPARTAPQGAAAQPDEIQQSSSYIGKTVRLEGKISGDGDVTIEGHFRGDLHLKRNLVVGGGGQLEADIKAAAVTVAGHVAGSITADTMVRILESGSVEGSLNAPRITIAEGGQLRGQVNQTEG